MRDGLSTRRRVLVTAGTISLAGVAGCIGGDDELEPEPDDDHGDMADNDDDDHGDDDHEDMDEHDDDGHGNGDHEHDTDHEVGHPESHITVEMMSMEGKEHFIPHVVHVEPGGMVTWELVDDLESHDVTSYHEAFGKPTRIPADADPWQSPLIGTPGETFELTFDVEGVYDYYCDPHYEDDMIGRVIVGWPDPDPETQPALAPPEDELLANEHEMIEMFNETTIPVLENGGH